MTRSRTPSSPLSIPAPIQSGLTRLDVAASDRGQRRVDEAPVAAPQAGDVDRGLPPGFTEDGHHTDRFVAWTEPADVTVRAGNGRGVRRAIDQLPESYRTVLLLRDIEGLDTEETAKMLKITPNAVKIRLHRARMALRKLIAPSLQGPQP